MLNETFGKETKGEYIGKIKFAHRPVFRDLNIKIAETSMTNSTFVANANWLIPDLVEYTNLARQLNAHRAGLERMYLNTGLNEAQIKEYRAPLIDYMQGEAKRLKAVIADLKATLENDKDGGKVIKKEEEEKRKRGKTARHSKAEDCDWCP